MDESGYTLETAGALDNGRKVWALARTGIVERVDTREGNEIAAYVLLATSCDKTLATTAAFTSIRVVCKNTLFFATEDVRKKGRPQVKVPHNLYFDPTVVKAQLGTLYPAWKALLGKVRKMAHRQIEVDEADSFFKSLLVQKQDKALSRTAAREIQTSAPCFSPLQARRSRQQEGRCGERLTQ